MTQTRGPDEQVITLAGRHYDHLLLAGEQGLALNPIVYVTAPSHARVLWAGPGRLLEGYEVSKLGWHAIFDTRQFEDIGFGPDAQYADLWVLRGVRYAPREPNPSAGWKQESSASHLFASYDPAGRR